MKFVTNKYLPFRRRMKPGSKRKKTMLQLSKRHPVYSKRVDSNDGAVKTDDANGDQEARAGILCKVCKVFVKMF